MREKLQCRKAPLPFALSPQLPPSLPLLRDLLAFLTLCLSVFWVWLGEPKLSKAIHNWILCMLNHTHLLTGWPRETGQVCAGNVWLQERFRVYTLRGFPHLKIFFKLNSIQIFKWSWSLITWLFQVAKKYILTSDYCISFSSTKIENIWRKTRWIGPCDHHMTQT